MQWNICLDLFDLLQNPWKRCPEAVDDERRECPLHDPDRKLST
jgi:hypothetical protein